MAGHLHVEHYQDEAGEWRWRIQAGNGEIIAASSEGYVERRDSEHAVDLTRQALTNDGED